MRETLTVQDNDDQKVPSYQHTLRIAGHVLPTLRAQRNQIILTDHARLERQHKF